MSCRESVVDLRPRRLYRPHRFTRLPPLHPSPRSGTTRVKREDPNSKTQIPRKFQTSTLQLAKDCAHIFLEFGIWELKFPWDLEPGIWDLTSSSPAESSLLIKD